MLRFLMLAALGCLLLQSVSYCGDKKEKKELSADEKKQADLHAKIERLLLEEVKDDERKLVAQGVSNYLNAKGTKTDLADVGLALDIGRAFEFAKNDKAAVAAMKQYAQLFAKASDAKVAEQAKLLEGVARRLTLLGSTMELKGKTLDGKAFDLKNLKGKVVLVDFWATWCMPCVDDIPHIKKLYTRYHQQGFEVIGISLDDSEAELKKFITKEALPWGCVFDGDPNKGGGLADHYGVISIPFAVLVGRDGRVISTRARGAELTRLLEAIYDEKK